MMELESNSPISRVGFVQLKPRLLEVEENVDKALKYLEKIEADLIVLPELFSSGYNFSSRKEVEIVSEKIPEGFTTQKLMEVSKERNLRIVAGIPEKKHGKFFNSAIYVNKDFVGVYRKVHLFYREKKFFEAGEDFFVFDDVGVMICFDWVFPESSRILMLKGAKIISHPSNLILPYCPEAMKTRSIENRVFTVTANRVGREGNLVFTGLSQVTDPFGNVLYRASKDREESFVAKIDLKNAENKDWNELNNIIKDRRRDIYKKYL